MAVSLAAPESIDGIPGVRVAAVAAGIRYRNRDDLVLFELSPGSTVAAVFTRNAFCAAPVIVAREHLRSHGPRYWLINSGNANAGTGEDGITRARKSCAAVASATGCLPDEVLPFSTGVIGEPLAVDKIESAIPSAVDTLDRDGWMRAARAIMTTDTIPKGMSRRVRLPDGEVTISGIAKGAGMIRPDMATMLAYLATDAKVESGILQRLLVQAVNRSFNCITIDGDTSTNDACVLAATGASGVSIDDDEAIDAFKDALNEICEFLAQAIVRDGEGATKFVTIEVDGAHDEAEARRVAFTVAHSPLVKTALFASDPNWGRILAAVGRAGVEALDVSAVSIHVGDLCIVENGGRSVSYTEAAGQAVMAEAEIPVLIDLHRGDARARVWTCDFSFDYVKINAEYRT